METTLYNQQGKAVGKVALPETVFSAKWNADLVHQVVTAMQANERDPIAHTKGRGEVRGGGKKPWRQKGTGRARHGSSRSPIWVGGGITHGPRNERSFAQRIPRRMRAQALASALSKKHADGEVAVVDALSLSNAKTREAASVIAALAAVKGFETMAGKRKNALLIAVPQKSAELARAFRNIGNVTLAELRNVNVLDLLTNRFCAIVGGESALSSLAERVAGPKRGEKTA